MNSQQQDKIIFCIYRYRGSQNYKTTPPPTSLRIIKFSPTKEALIRDLMPYIQTPLKHLSYAISISIWLNINNIQIQKILNFTRCIIIRPPSEEYKSIALMFIFLSQKKSCQYLFERGDNQLSTEKNIDLYKLYFNFSMVEETKGWKTYIPQ